MSGILYYTPRNFAQMDTKRIQEAVSSEIVVEPQQSMTVRELVYRIAMGLPVKAGVMSGTYPEQDENFDDVLPTENPDFDLADYAEMKRNLQSKYKTKVVPKEEPKEPKEEPKEPKES